MTLQTSFIISFKGWFFLQLFLNILGLMFINTVKSPQAHNYGMAYLVESIIMSYIIFIVLFLQYEYIKETEKPFHQWVWLDTQNWVQVFVTILSIIIWIIIGFIMVSDMEGITYLLGGWFILSLFYWTFVAGCIEYSYKRQTPGLKDQIKV